MLCPHGINLKHRECDRCEEVAYAERRDSRRFMDMPTLAEDNAILVEQFKVACKRSEAWKKMALAVREEYGKVMKLLGEAAAYIFTMATYQKQGKGLPPRFAEECAELDHRIESYVTTARAEIPEMLREELQDERLRPLQDAK